MNIFKAALDVYTLKWTPDISNHINRHEVCKISHFDGTEIEDLRVFTFLI